MKRTVVAVALLMLASCASGEGTSRVETPADEEPTTSSTSAPASTTTSSSTSTSTSSTSTSTTTSTTTIDPLALAAQRYLDLVRPSNCNLLEYWAALDAADTANVATWVEWRDLAAGEMTEQRDLYIDFISALASTQWPVVVEADVDGLMTELAEEAGWMDSFLMADTEAAMQALIDQERPAGSAAAKIRAKLGLPSNLGTDGDPCDG